MESLCGDGVALPSGKLLLNHVRCKQILRMMTGVTNGWREAHASRKKSAEDHLIDLDSYQRLTSQSGRTGNLEGQ